MKSKSVSRLNGAEAVVQVVTAPARMVLQSAAVIVMVVGTIAQGIGFICFTSAGKIGR